MSVLSDDELNARLRSVLDADWVDIPDEPGFGGTGAPGRLLERLLGVNGGNFDIPDAGRWEIKYHSGGALLTLFHLEGEPRGHMHNLIAQFGWADQQGRTSFRHTIRSKSDLGFFIVNESDRIVVRHNELDESVSPYWTHDRLISAFAAKLRRLLLVHGAKSKGRVRYEAASFYSEPMVTGFAAAVEQGIVAVDFDARTTDGAGLRNHGTKFRIDVRNLSTLYHLHNPFE